MSYNKMQQEKNAIHTDPGGPGDTNRRSDEPLANEPVGHLLFRLFVPSICAELVVLLYSTVDRIYLGRIPGTGVAVLAGLGITGPVITMINAFGQLIGSGGGPLVAISMGREDTEKAHKVLANSVLLLAVVSIVLTLLLILFCEPVLRLFGADADTLPYAQDYMRIYAIGNVFTLAALGLNPFLTTQGFNKISMKYTSIGAGLNIILDPIFIYGFGLGIRGAAIATLISQLVSAVLMIRFLFGEKTKIRLRFYKPELWIMKEILSLGVVTFFFAITQGISHVVCFRMLLRYGSSMDVTVLTIIFTINQFLMLPVNGLGQGSQPIFSYNYGAKNGGRIRQTLRLVITWIEVSIILGVVLIELFPENLFRIFTKDEQIIAMGVPAIRIYMIGMLIFGIHMGIQGMFQSIGFAKTAIYVSFFRKGILLIPLVLILPGISGLGTTGVYLAETITDVITVINASVMYFVMRKRIYQMA